MEILPDSLQIRSNMLLLSFKVPTRSQGLHLRDIRLTSDPRQCIPLYFYEHASRRINSFAGDASRRESGSRHWLGAKQ